MNNLKELMLNATKNRKPFVIRKFFLNIPKWDFFIDYLNHCVKTNSSAYFKTKDYYFILNVGAEDLLNVGHVFKDEYKILNSAHEYGIIENPVFLISLFDNVENLTQHSDPRDQIHIGCIGKSSWKITLDDGTIENYIIGPGDLVFIPIGLQHKVESMTHRVGITFSANIKEEI